jgi:imidazolonepropionase-like amidohydrolase
VLGAAALPGFARAAAPAPAVRALVGGRLVDGTGGPPLENAALVIEGERITAVGPAASVPIPEGAEVVSTEGMTVLPGLIDLDVRLSRLGHGNLARWDETYVPLAARVVMPAAARQLLLAGVTTARDLASPLDAALSVRDRIRDGRIPGPTLFVSGPVLEADPPPGAREYRWGVAGAPDARQKAERVLRAGADLLLVADADRLAPAELAALVEAARTAARPVWAEVRRDTDVRPALAAGVDGLVAFGSGTATEWPPEVVAELRARAARGAAVPWTAGVSALTNFEWLAASREPLDAPQVFEGIPAIVANDIRGSLADPAAVAYYESAPLRRPAVGSRLRSAREAGARLLAGSGAGAPGHLHSRATWQEIEALVVDGGVPALAAIAQATSEAAAVLGVQHETGSLLPGKYADVLVVRGDALRYPERVQDVEVVLRRGLRWR